jgi:hypothetical protein
MSLNEDTVFNIFDFWNNETSETDYEKDSDGCSKALRSLETVLTNEDSQQDNVDITSTLENYTCYNYMLSSVGNNQYSLLSLKRDFTISDTPDQKYISDTPNKTVCFVSNRIVTESSTSKINRYDQVQVKIFNLMKKLLINEINTIKVHGLTRVFNFPNYKFTRDFFQNKIEKNEIHAVLSMKVKEFLLQMNYMSSDSYNSNKSKVDLLEKSSDFEDSSILQKTFRDYFVTLNTPESILEKLKIDVPEKFVKEFLLKSGLQN